MPTLALLCAMAGPASASVTEEWRDLHERCETAILEDAALDVDGLVSTGPDYLVAEVDDPVFGSRLELEVARISGRMVPAGIWRAPEGRLELRLIEYPTRKGTRAICEIRRARGAAAPDAIEGSALEHAFATLRDAALDAGRATPLEGAGDRLAMRYADPGPRGCDVIASLRHDDRFLRASVAERAGDPDCGGHSLLAGRRELQIEGERR